MTDLETLPLEAPGTATRAPSAAAPVSTAVSPPWVLYAAIGLLAVMALSLAVLAIQTARSTKLQEEQVCLTRALYTSRFSPDRGDFDRC